MKKKRRSARPPKPPARPSTGSASAALERSSSESPAPRVPAITKPPTPKRSLAVTSVVAGVFLAMAAGGVFAMVMVNRWISPEDALPWSVMALSFTITGVGGLYFALSQNEARALPYVARTLREVLPIVVAIGVINVAVILQSRRAPVVDPDSQLRDQVERLSAERKDLMKALFAAGKFETQANALKGQLQERERAFASAEQERKALLADVEKLKAQVLSEQSRTAGEKDAALAQLRADLDGRSRRLAELENAQREIRNELQSLQQDLRRGRRVTESRVSKVVSKLPPESPIAAE